MFRVVKMTHTMCLCRTSGKQGKDPAVDVIAGVRTTLHTAVLMISGNDLAIVETSFWAHFDGVTGSGGGTPC